MPGISEFAGFAILLLLIVVNQAGCEQVFSNLKVQQVERLTEISEEEVLMEELVEQMENEWLDNGAIEQEGDDYEP